MIEKTKQTPIEANVSIWAVPDSAAENSGLPFKYECYASPFDYAEPYDEGAVKVHETLVTVVVPAGIDLVKSALETLAEAKEKAFNKAEEEMQEVMIRRDEKVERLDMRINNLARLTWDGDNA